LAEPIRYRVDLTDRRHHLVRVALTVPADLSDGARIVLPVWTPGSYVVRDYVHHVQWISGLARRW
jgi:predicted metalloprotease with PDZ domain